jgi:hypothetical protein
MPRSGRIEPVQSGLRHHHRPVRMPAPHLLQNAQHRSLNWIRHLHHHQQQVGLSLTPGNVLRGVIVRLSKSARVEKSEQWNFWRYVVEKSVSRARFKSFPDHRIGIARESRDNRCLACSRFA